MCDGSVRSVPQTIGQAVWWAMLGRDDGIIFDIDDLDSTGPTFP